MSSGVPTAAVVAPSAMRLIRPLSTLPAPTSVKRVTPAAAMKATDSRQRTVPVTWRESVAFMAGAGVTTFYEVGAGKVLSGLIKRIADGASTGAIGTPDDIAAFKAKA